jgi:monoamine oxidase
VTCQRSSKNEQAHRCHRWRICRCHGGPRPERAGLSGNHPRGRDRIGGRTNRRKFAGTDVEVETGGAWFAGPKQRYAHREIVRHGIRYKPDPALTTFGHLVGGKRIETSLPIEPEDYLAFERASFHVLNAAQHLDPDVPIDLQPLKSFDLTWDEFISQVELTPTIRDLFDTQGVDACGSADANGSALTFLWNTALFDNSIVNWGSLTDQQLEGGTKALIDAILGDAPEVDVRLETPVASVEQDGARVKVTTVDGVVFEADGAVVALPVNLWEKVRFDPPLSPDKVAGAALRPGIRGVKAWALVKDAPSGFFGYGSVDASHGVTMLNSQGEVDGHQLLMALSPVGCTDDFPDGFNPLDKAAVQRAIDAFLPGAEVLEVDGDDWNADPYSDGSWSTYKVGQMEYLGGMRKPEGRLTFAGSDICRGWVSWVDGAIESGVYAAAQIDRLISSD